MINTIDTTDFEQIKAVVGIFEELEHDEPRLLYGHKLTGFGQGYMMPTGGKHKPDDNNNPVTVAKREGFEEAQLQGWSNIVAGQIIVTIRDKRQVLLIDIVIFTSWSGDLKWNGEFESLEFLPLSTILNSKILPHDGDWLRRVFLEEKPSLVKILCGRDREDVLEFEMLDFPPKK